jgi:hypothetical protein
MVNLPPGVPVNMGYDFFYKAQADPNGPVTKYVLAADPITLRGYRCMAAGASTIWGVSAVCSSSVVIVQLEESPKRRLTS